jgi:hypothetical protein
MSLNIETEIMNTEIVVDDEEFVLEKKIDLNLQSKPKGKKPKMNTEPKVVKEKKVVKSKKVEIVAPPLPPSIPVNNEESESEDEVDEEPDEIELLRKQKEELEKKLMKAEKDAGLKNYKKNKEQVNKDVKEYIDEKVALLYRFCKDNDIEEWIINMMPDEQGDFLGDNEEVEDKLIEKIYNMKNKPKAVRKVSEKTGKPKSPTAVVVVDGEEKAIGKARQKVIADANANIDKIVCKNIMTTAGKLGAFRGDILCFVKDGKVVLPSVKEFNEIVDATPELSSELIVDKKRKNFKEVCKWVIA